MNPAELGLAALFASWFALSVVRQFNAEWAARLVKWDEVGVLPVWRFFAPIPGCFDYHVVYRDCSSNGTLTRWKELSPATTRRPLAALWNPAKRHTKGLYDVVTVLARELSTTDALDISVSVPYLVLLNYVCAAPRDSEAQRTQFAIMATPGAAVHEPASLIFSSHLHRLR